MSERSVLITGATGAVGPTGLFEKDVTLDLARKLAAALESRVGARVVLTRDDDSVVSLDQRTALANQYKADLFLSVHMNAAVVKGAKGSETYFLSLDASDELARRAAETENAAAMADCRPPAQMAVRQPEAVTGVFTVGHPRRSNHAGIAGRAHRLSVMQGLRPFGEVLDRGDQATGGKPNSGR